jgi:hypothetical protein
VRAARHVVVDRADDQYLGAVISADVVQFTTRGC